MENQWDKLDLNKFMIKKKIEDIQSLIKLFNSQYWRLILIS